ncbi:hypothetical protein Thiowin_01045 [Thiorhodovibrio winogradskyi]|uniref:Uncharacterized protein n=1 Tax=Thiorhodovibrio winogradskyi TaxID=77007 RepID=A0ABZ0S4W8_9GAMM
MSPELSLELHPLSSNPPHLGLNCNASLKHFNRTAFGREMSFQVNYARLQIPW